jgi:membrane-bound lytic murein transglycosylase MltF
MAKQRPSNVEQWLKRETPRVRKALESASRYFDANDELTVNTLEAIYGQENSFGILMGTRGSARAAGHFQFEPKTARRYGLIVSKGNDQRFDIDRASSAAARYLKDLNTWFGERTSLGKGLYTIPVKSISERKKFILGAFNAGEGRVARAQHLAQDGRRNPHVWSDVVNDLAQAKAGPAKAKETREYVEMVPLYEAEFAQKSPANKTMKKKGARKGKSLCTVGHWRTIDERPVFICA